MKSITDCAAARPAPLEPAAPASVNAAMGLTEWLLIIVLSMIWGGSFFFIEVAVNEVTPLTLVLFRVGFAAMALLVFGYLTGRRLPASLLLVAFLIPISAILLGVFILGERLGWNALGGMLLIFTGLIAIDGRLIEITKGGLQQNRAPIGGYAAQKEKH